MSSELSHEFEKTRKSFVYQLLDPRNGQVLFIGQGSSADIAGAMRHAVDSILSCTDTDGSISMLARTIAQIRKDDADIIPLLHRKGMSEEEAEACMAELCREGCYIPACGGYMADLIMLARSTDQACRYYIDNCKPLAADKGEDR